MADAPVCHIPAASNIPQPTPSALPAIPPVQAGDWQSVIDAINALALGYQLLSGQVPPPGDPGQPGQPGSPGRAGKDAKTGGRFIELSRGTKQVRITNPDDDSQFVDVEIINRLVMKDTVTGEQWVWQR